MDLSAKAEDFIPYLRSCKQECEKPIEGERKGEIPRWMKGCLIRIGPGLLEIGPDKFNHVFDGMALVHRFDFRDGNVTYQNRFLQSDSYRSNRRVGRIVVSELATRGAPDPCKTIFERFASLFSLNNFTDNDLINIVMYDNEAFACTEINNIWKIDAETLDSLQKVNIRRYVPVNGALAHPHKDMDGTVYNIGTSYGLRSHYNVIKFPPKEDKNASPFEKGSVVCKIPASKMLNPSYYHSFAMTENYFIMVEQPLYLSLTTVARAQLISGTIADALHWNSNTPTRFHVVRRSDGQLMNTSYFAATFFVFHHINAYEESDHIILDLCAYEKGDFINSMYVNALKEAFRKAQKHKHLDIMVTRARRYVLPLKIDSVKKGKGKNMVKLPSCEATATLNADGSVSCTFEILTGTDPWSPELPRINYERYNGKKYRYFYAMSHSGVLGRTSLIKVDTETKKTISWSEHGVIPSEPVFLAEPDPINQEEDSGILLASLLYQDDEKKVSILVLSAESMQERGRVTFWTNSVVPGDFHGTFIQRT